MCQSGDRRQCWQIDAHSHITVAPLDSWPSAAAHLTGDHAGPVRSEGNVEVIAPDGVSVDVRQGDDSFETIDVCTNGVCKQLRPKQRKNLDDVRAVTLLGDGHTVFVGQGVAAAAAEHLVRYDLAHPGAGTEVAKCAEVLDIVAGNLVIQQTDCANMGGPRLLVSPGGKRLATLGKFFSTSAPNFAVGGTRWLLVGYQGFSVWDLANGKQLASLPDCPP